MESLPSETSSRPIVFEPSWEGSRRLIWELLAATESGDLEAILRDIYLGHHRSSGDLKVQFAASLLGDVLRAGGTAWVRDSKLYVQWPSWDGQNGKKSAQQALLAVRDIRPLTGDELARVTPLFAPDIDGEQMADVLREGQFCLTPVSEIHPTGVPYGEAFSAALRYWTMPYRGRSGRSRRFVLCASHRHLGAFPVVAGILELGDEAPFCTWRDDLLGLSPTTFARWLLSRDTASRAESISTHLEAVRSCLLQTKTGWDISGMDAGALVSDRAKVESASSGRSTDSVSENNVLKDRKRLAHGLRLARGELAVRKIANGAPVNEGDPDLAAGVRAIHDLVIPRVHLEATVCGAIPPFTEGLGGKLLTAFLSHPSIISAVKAAESQLLGWSFDLDRLQRLIPSHGLLCLTTKGLYSNHAAIYNRAETLGKAAPIRFRHLANTAGATTTLISAQTTAIAKRLLSDPAIASRKISMIYGSGGSKRHRVIEAATHAVGLSTRLAMAGIRRPVYGMTFVENPMDVIWLGTQPAWIAPTGMSESSYSAQATQLWRSRWLQRATARVQDYALMPSMIRALLENTQLPSQ